MTDLTEFKKLLLGMEDESKIDSWQLTITRVDNGYLLEGPSESDMPMKVVIEDSREDELKSHEFLLWDVMEYFNFGGSKHDAQRIKIIREKQNEND